MKYKDKEWLENQILNEYNTYEEISEQANCSRSTIKRWADKHNIDLNDRECESVCSYCASKIFVKDNIIEYHEYVFCSQDCKQSFEPRKQNVECFQCGQGFRKLNSQIKVSDKDFCSRDCRAEYFVGEKHPTENTKTIECVNCKENFERPESQISKQNNFCTVNCYHDWCEHNKERDSNEAKKWRNDIRERDDWICQDCGQEGGDIEAHHIKSWNEYPGERFDLENGISLCIECHYIRHEERGDRRAIGLMKDRVNAERVEELKKRRKESEP